ncbi:MAG TPA: ribonuclease III [Aggregatilineales bacterium]|nr:ribonuclease III [Aggregatilineales bacterium]
MADADPAELQQRVGLEFRDKSLLIRALTHPSYAGEHPEYVLEDNQRLEFLGDAVLGFLSAKMLYHRFPEAPEGRLTRLRAALVRTETLARFAEEGIAAALLLGRGEEESGGRDRTTNLAAAFESVVGALYLDQGLDAVQQYVDPLFDTVLEETLHLDFDKDAKSRLQEWTQASLGVMPTYEIIASEGPDHAKQFTVAVIIDGEERARGTGSNKQSASQEAARRALELLTAAGDA